MKTARTGPPSMPGNSRSSSKECSWRPKALRSATMSMSPRCSRSSMISPAQVPKIGLPGGVEGAQRLGQALALDAERHRRRLAAGHDEPVEAVEVARACAPRAPRRPSAAQDAACAAKPPCRARTPTQRRRCSPAAAGEQLTLVELARLERLPSPGRGPRWPRATRVGVVEVRGGLDDRARRASPGPTDLKMPEPTKTASAPSCMTSDASAGVAMPPAQNSGTGSLPSWATPRTRSSGARSSLAAVMSSISLERAAGA